MKFLQEIGPDTLIPCFSVNIRGNTDVNVCNAIIKAIFNDLCHATTEESEQRIPMIVTSSTMNDHKHCDSMEHFKERLGVRRAKAALKNCCLSSVTFVSFSCLLQSGPYLSSTSK